MAGGKRRSNIVKSGNGFTKNRKNNSRRRSYPSSSIRGDLFIDGGYLSDGQFHSVPSGFLPGEISKAKGKSGVKSAYSEPKKTLFPVDGTQKSKGTTIGYEYPSTHIQDGFHSESCGKHIYEDRGSVNSQSFILLGSESTPIVAYVDKKPSLKTPDLDYTYDYCTSFVLGESSHRGLGFHDEEKLFRSPNPDDDSPTQVEEQEVFCVDSLSSKEIVAEESVDCMAGDEMVDELLGETFPPKKYSDVVQTPENSGFLSIGGMRLYTQDISDQQSDDGDLSDGSSESCESSASDSSIETSFTDSDIDDEVVEDYLEGIGGSEILLNSKWLTNLEFLESNDNSVNSCIDEAVVKLGGIALQEASKEYGMKKTPSRKKDVCALDDLLVNDSRTPSAKKKKIADFSRSWPSEALKSRTLRKYPGEKKKYRKEMIAAKRRARMLSRGVDLRDINLKMEQIVLNGEDMFSFQPMHSSDCSQVRRLAAIYHLRSGCQGSGKKRFVTVSRTQHTAMPSLSDRIRLEQLIGARDEDDDFSVVEGTNIKSLGGNRSIQKKAVKATRVRLLDLDQSMGKKVKDSINRRLSQKKNGKRESYADQPISFISYGVMHSETKEMVSKEVPNMEKGKSVIGAFEMHTRGFGSRMMAKMGFIEGGGLGKDCQGMVHPIEVMKRPKSLGLGVEFFSPRTSDSNQGRRESSQTTGLGKSQRIGF